MVTLLLLILYVCEHKDVWTENSRNLSFKYGLIYQRKNLQPSDVHVLYTVMVADIRYT